MSDSTTLTQQRSTSSRYWCHHCEREVPIYLAPDLTCQRCNEQFIEEMDTGGDDPRHFLDGADEDDEEDGDIYQFFRSISQPPTSQGRNSNMTIENVLQTALSNLLTTGLNDDRSGNNHSEEQAEEEEERTPVYFNSGAVDGNVQLTPMNRSPLNNTHSNRQEGRIARLYFQVGEDDEDDEDDYEDENGDDEEVETIRRNNRASSLQGLLRAIAAFTGADMDMVGNPNDYVFSQTALDNIITQLMEQTGSITAPPPAPDDVIAALRKRPLSEKEFKDQIDCSVCKDEFLLDELVTELSCMHLFHKDCINPWLKVNGTCPVCRHSVIEENNDASQRVTTTETSPSLPSSPSPISNSDITTTPLNNNPLRSTAVSPVSAAFAWMTRSSTPPFSWPTPIPGAFSWGPGNSARHFTQPTESDDESVDMAIDLD